MRLVRGRHLGDALYAVRSEHSGEIVCVFFSESTDHGWSEPYEVDNSRRFSPVAGKQLDDLSFVT